MPIIYYPLFPSSSGGSVTSVGMTGDGVIFSPTVNGSPVTSSGTLVPMLLQQTENTVLAGPTSGAGTPTFRALVAADIPDLSASQITSGVLAVAQGGTGTASPSLVAGTNVTITGTWPDQTINASGGTAGGSDTQVQYNDSGSFGGDAGFTWDYTDQILTLGLTDFTAEVANSPSLVLAGSYESDETPTYAEDSWTIQNIIGSGENGQSALTLTHSGSPLGVLQIVQSGIDSQPTFIAGTTVANVMSYGLIDNDSDYITNVVNNSTPAAETQWATAVASAQLGASGDGAILSLGAASGPTFEIACNEYGEYALATGDFKFLDALYLGAALYDSTASAGSAGAILNSTGSAVVWTSVPTLSTLVLTGAPPTVSAGQLGLGSTTGFGNGSSGTAVTTTTQGTGSGPVTPQTVAGYIEANVGGTTVWLPYFE